MSTTIRSTALSSLILRLDRGNLTTNSKDDLLEAITEKTMQITKDSNQARCLFANEKRIIEKRGNASENYLLGDHFSSKDILGEYYKRVKEIDGERKLVAPFTISEKMLMLGIFNHMLDVRNKSYQSHAWNARGIRIKAMIHNILKTIKKGAPTEDYDFVLSLTENSKAMEDRMMTYVSSQTLVIMDSILSELGITMKESSRKQMERICTEAYELCEYSPKLAASFEKRNSEMPSVYSDVEFYTACGEKKENLQGILAPERKEVAKQKRI